MWSTSPEPPPAQPVDPALAASAAALLSALVREEPLPAATPQSGAVPGSPPPTGPGTAAPPAVTVSTVPAPGVAADGVPAPPAPTLPTVSVVPAEWAGQSAEQARRKGLFARR